MGHGSISPTAFLSPHGEILTQAGLVAPNEVKDLPYNYQPISWISSYQLDQRKT